MSARRYACVEDRLIANSYLAPCPKPELGDCWIWAGRVNGSGYGCVNVRENGRHVTKLAHRYSVEVFRGRKIATKNPNAPKRVGAHLCNVRRCINPMHLKVLTHSANIRQSVAEGRHSSVNRKANNGTRALFLEGEASHVVADHDTKSDGARARRKRKNDSPMEKRGNRAKSGASPRAAGRVEAATLF